MLQGKTALIFGIANKRSIAWAIAQAFRANGARLALAYQERMEGFVRDLTKDMKDVVLLKCDVNSDEQLSAVYAKVDEEFGGLDILVHSIAFANKEDISGRFVDVSRAGFQLALDVSAYSLVELSRRAEPLMEKRGGGSIMTMTFLGSERVVPNYNLMGVAKAALEASVRYLARDLGPKNIRVNAISAGPLRTLSARGVADFSSMEEAVRTRSPLQRNIEASEVGNTAVYLASSLSSGVTGEILFVDSGFHILGM